MKIFQRYQRLNIKFESWQCCQFVVISSTDPESFVRGGPNLITFFFFFFFFLFVDGGIEDLNTALNGPSLACYRNAISIAGRWWPNIKCWFGSFVIFHGIQTSIAKKPFIFVIFQGVGPDPLSPSLDPPMYLTTRCTQTKTIRII